MASIAQVVVRFGVDIKDFTTKMQKATREIQAMGRQMQSTGKNLTRGLTLPIAALGGASVKLAADFDESMTKIQTLVGVSANVVDGFKASVLDLAGKTAQAPAELADALFTVTSAGIRGAEAMQVLEMAAKGSAIGMGETKEIARAVTAVMQAYGPETMSAAKAMDILTATVREGNLEASELAPVLGRVVGLAAQLGVGFDQVGASIATFTRLGVDSAEAVTGLRGFLSGLIKPTQQGAAALAEVGLSFNELRREVEEKGLAQTMIKLIQTFDGNVEALGAVIPNVRALGAVMGTAGVQGASYLEIQKNIANSSEILNEAFHKTSKSGAFVLKQTLAQLKKIGTDIGSIVLPVLADLAQDVKAAFDRFSDLNQGTKETIVKIAAFAAAVGPAVYVLGTMITSIGSLTKALRVLGVFLSTNPWFALAGAIGAVVLSLTAYNGISKQVSKTSESNVEKVEAEKKELNSLVKTIQRLNEDNDTRKELLKELQEKYPDFLGNISAEEVTNAQLRNRLKEVNQEYVNKIALAAAEEEIIANLQRQKALQKSILELEKQKTELQERINYEDTITGQQIVQREIEATTFHVHRNKRALKELKEQLVETKDAYAALAQQLGTDVSEPTQNPISSAGASSERNIFDAPAAGMKPLVSLVQDLDMQVKGLGDEFTNTFAKAEEGVNIAENLFSGLASTLSGIFSGMLQGAKLSFTGIIQFIGRLIAKLAAAAIAAAILSALIPGGGGKVAEAQEKASGFAKFFKMFAGFRADGGPVSAGKSYIVGERGPELFSPNTSGAIIPNHALSTGVSGSMHMQIVGNVPITFQPNGTLTAVLAQEQVRLKKLGG